MLFKLMGLTVGSFAILKANDGEEKKFPIEVHGFIQVVNNGFGKYFPILRSELVSDELAGSDELDALKEKAVERTIEDIVDAYSD